MVSPATPAGGPRTFLQGDIAMTFQQVSLSLLAGFQTTLYIFFVVLVFALPLGLVISFGSMSRFQPLRWFTRFVIWVIRGTPLMLQVITVFYLPGLVFNMPMKSRMFAVLVAFIINYSIYFSEIYRAGIEAIPQGQYEAGQVLGMTKPQIFRHIVLLQVIKRILPPMTNEIITLVKDTALARVIMVVELIKAAQDIVAAHGLIWPLFYTAVFYLLIVGVLTLALGAVEKKLDYYKG
jgi:polar amino acid transport system permease protein